jgi:hypothetical protein
MKYLIKESQLDVAIKRQLDIMFDVPNINWIFGSEYDSETGRDFEDTSVMEFYYGDYYDDNSIFVWYDRSFWDENPDNYIKFTSNSPIVVIDEPYHSNLNNLFGNLWYKPFKEWFKQNFQVSVKSVMDEIHNRAI